MAIAGTRARLVTFEPTGPITARNVQDAIAEAAAGGGGGGGSQTATVHVTAADILAIGDGTPRVLVPAPDEDTVLAPLFAVFVYHAGAVAYDFDPGLIVTWSTFQSFSVAGFTETLNGLQDAAYFQLAPFAFGISVGEAPNFTSQGQALVLTAANVFPFAPPLGDGTVDMTVYYLTVSLLPA